MFLYADVVIDNLFIRAIQRGICSLTFFDIYNFFYYVHEHLSYNHTAAMVICCKDDIYRFAANNIDTIKIGDERIDILYSADLLKNLTNDYQVCFKYITDAFDFAFSRLLKNKLNENANKMHK
jgi:hypothetical protein